MNKIFRVIWNHATQSWVAVWGSDNICIEINKKIWREKMR